MTLGVQSILRNLCEQSRATQVSAFVLVACYVKARIGNLASDVTIFANPLQ